MTHFLRNGSPFNGSDADIARGFTVIRNRCGKCGGTGNLPCFRHVEGGVCFQCAGSGRGTDTQEKLYTADKLARLNETAAKKAAAKVAKINAERAKLQAEIDARRAAFVKLHGPVLAWLETVGRDRDGDYREGFLGDVLRRANVTADWSEGQATAVYAAFAKDQARAVVRAASAHVGTVGQRLELEVTAERETSYLREAFRPSFYGGDSREEVYITTLRTADGSAIVVKSPSFRVPVGDTLTIRGTVKEHSDFRGEAQTILSRATVKTQKERLAA